MEVIAKSELKEKQRAELILCISKEGKGKKLLSECFGRLSPFIEGEDWSDHADYWDRDANRVF